MRYVVLMNGEPIIKLPRAHIAGRFVDRLCQAIIIPCVLEIYDSVDQKTLIKWEFKSPFRWLSK